MNVSIKGNTKQIQKDLGKLTNSELPRATVQALNRTGTAVVGRTAKLASSRTKIKQKTLRGRMERKKANKFNMSYSFITNLNAVAVHTQLSAGRLQAGKKRPSKGAGVTWRGKVFTGSFIGNGRVFKRTTPKRLPLEMMRIDIEREFKRSADRVTKIIGPKIFVKEFTRSTKYAFSKRR